MTGLQTFALSRLDDAVASAVADGAAAVVFRGEGGHFCAGADLKELEDQSFDTRLRGVLERIATAPVPKFAMPCVLGPTSRMPRARAVATISS